MRKLDFDVIIASNKGPILKVMSLPAMLDLVLRKNNNI